LEETDTRWVGAWWIGYIILMFPILVVSPISAGYSLDSENSMYRVSLCACAMHNTH